MNISIDHVGDVLCFYETGKRIRICDVSDEFVAYESETGETYCTKK